MFKTTISINYNYILIMKLAEIVASRASNRFSKVSLIEVGVIYFNYTYWKSNFFPLCMNNLILQAEQIVWKVLYTTKSTRKSNKHTILKYVEITPYKHLNLN